MFINDLPLSWENENGPFADDVRCTPAAQPVNHPDETKTRL